MATAPKGFDTVSKACLGPGGQKLNVIGVVVDVGSPTTTQRGDQMITVRILDPGMLDEVSAGGLRVRFFGDARVPLPQMGRGDVVVLRNIVHEHRDGAALLVRDKRMTEVTVVQKSTIPTTASIAGSNATSLQQLSGEEQSYVVALSHALSAHLASIGSHKPRRIEDPQYNPWKDRSARPRASVNFGTKFKLISQMRHIQYGDLVVEVVKKWYTQLSTGKDKLELYVTDYTENEDLWLYDPPEEQNQGEDGYEGDPYKYQKLSKKEWIGPWGQRVLKVNLFEPHAVNGNVLLKPGSLVWLHNVKGKANPEAKLEGDMWPDDQDRQQVNVRPITEKNQARWQATETKALLKRKEQYWSEREKIKEKLQGGPSAESEKGQQPPAESIEGETPQAQADRTMEDAATNAQEDHPMEDAAPNAKAKKKSEKRKKNKKAKKAAAREQEDQTMKEQNSYGQEPSQQQSLPIRTVNGDISSESAAKTGTNAIDAVKQAEDKNPHIRCANEKAMVINLRTVLDPNNERHMSTNNAGKRFILPFINAKYRVKVRVVDFEPKSLVKFAVPVRPGQDHYDGAKAKMPGETQYVWYFALLLEDATTPPSVKGPREQLWAHVQHKEAKKLLGKDIGEPEAILKDAVALAKLREKLCILWGNLEEKKKDEPLKNLPFDSCVFEYGYELKEDDEDKDDYPLGYQKMFQLFDTMIL